MMNKICRKLTGEQECGKESGRLLAMLAVWSGIFIYSIIMVTTGL